MSDYIDLKPGTPEAVSKGCTCERGQSGYPSWLCDGNCPVHGLVALAEELDDDPESKCPWCKDRAEDYPDGECQHGFIW